jgi:hypothetical protein
MKKIYVYFPWKEVSSLFISWWNEEAFCVIPGLKKLCLLPEE